MMHYAISPTFAVFLLASLVLAVTPGPAVIYLVTRTLAHGRRVGFASIGGVALGNLGNAALACVGLAVVFAISADAFLVVKLAGAAYLVFLGVRELRRAARRPAAGGAPDRDRPRPSRPGTPARSRAFRDGFLVALLNPKTALFFAAFLPQFVDPAGSPLVQSLSLGALFVAIAACTDTLYVLAADRLAPRLAALGARAALGRYIAGISFIALGVFVACSGSRSGK
ncbi:MAG TPA: LysE family translocator [Steroidobacteraceae bacterium]|nr:LysE family translocator [Steroidobacteraceae bacterium]